MSNSRSNPNLKEGWWTSRSAKDNNPRTRRNGYIPAVTNPGSTESLVVARAHHGIHKRRETPMPALEFLALVDNEEA
jgi:ribosomal protein L25 (general stress protein Ctc)